MNVIRGIISVFIAILLALVVAGWIWASGLESPKLEGSRTILALSGAAGVIGLVALWTASASRTPA